VKVYHYRYFEQYVDLNRFTGHQSYYYLRVTVPDLPLWLGVLKHKAPLGKGAHLPAKQFFLLWIFAYIEEF
jgi:hypothetical protein